MIDISTLTAKQRVDNGWRWLTENFRGWQNRVDVETLNLFDSSSCICGQVFSDKEESETGYEYSLGLFQEANSWISAAIPEDEEDRRYHVSAYLGFDNSGEGMVPLAELEEVWKNRLRIWKNKQARRKERRAAAKV